MNDHNLPLLHDVWDYQAPAESAERFRALLPQADEVGDREYYLEVQTQIARTFSLQGEFEAAHALLDEVEPQLRPLFPRAKMRYLLERGRCFNSAGAPETAVPLFQEAYEVGIDRGASQDLTIDAAHMLGIAMPTSQEQLDWNLLALDLAEKATDEKAKGWRGSLYNNIGWTYHDMGDYGKALEIFERTLHYYETEKPEQVQNIRIAKWSIGRTMRSLNRFDEAIAIQKGLEVAYEQSGEAPDGFVFEELAECYLQVGDEALAKNYFAQAYALLSQLDWFVRSYPERLQRMAGF